MNSKKMKSRININNNENAFIKKVVLENFLSFQRDEVDFSGHSKEENPRFILIIGPNWSGKTSIFQAIKFALGSNERDDRYKKWSDFIRNGQEHGMVEIHIQYNMELIKIRRTVMRGQSPFYEIYRNDDKDFKKVHAMEVQNTISELDINPDNQFAFVSQGKIDAIKNLKPIELCMFLEEGVGLKGLREEILQQKNSITNLDKEFQSLVSKKNSLNVSLDLLQPKLERLAQKRKLLEIKRKYQDELLWANKHLIQEKIKASKKRIETLQIEIDKKDQEVENYDKLIEEKRIKISKLDDDINDISTKLGELNYEKKGLMVKIEKWQLKKKKAKEELDVLSESFSKTTKIFEKFKSQKESLENEIKLIKKENSLIKQKIDNILKEQNELIRKIKQNREFLEEYNKVVSRKEDLLHKIQVNKSKIKDLNHDINEIFQSFKDIEFKLDKNKWFLENPSKSLLYQLDKELKEINLKLYDIDNNLKETEIEKSKRLQRLKSLQIALRERKLILPSNINILKEEINKRELEAKGPIIEFLKYDDELSYAIESVLGEKLLYSFIVKDWDTLNLLNKLKNKYHAYCNIYIPKKSKITPLPKFSANGVIGYLAELINIIDNDIDIQKVIYSKIKNCLVVKDYYSGKNLYKNYDFKGKSVTLKGEQIISYRYVYETPYVKKLKGLLSTGTQKEQAINLENDIKSLNSRINQLKTAQSKLDIQKKNLFNKKESFNDLLYNFNQKQRLTSKKNELYQIIYDYEQNNIDLKKKIKSLERKIDYLEDQKDPAFFKWNDRIKEIPAEMQALNEDEKKWDLKLNQNLEILNQVKENLNDSKIQLNEKKIEFQTKKENFQKADKEAFEIYRNLENVDIEIENAKKRINELKKLKKIYQEEKNQIDKQFIQLKLNLEQEIIKINSVKQELLHDEKDLKRINNEIGPKIIEKSEIRSIDEISKDISNLEKQLLEFYDVDENLIVEKEEIISGLKEITKNQKDLEKDIKSAIRTENKMEETYFKKFKSVISDLNEKVNQKFEAANIKAYCSLELTGKFEELGILIKAATSKDQLKYCTALSGGQISMVSICLILSLQEIKPSPLCMFDEAGMFLDEKNSEASYQMIKSTLEINPVQLIMFLPTSSKSLYQLADMIIGVARVGKNELSTIFKPKIIKKK
jgi:chromosome segregation protein